MAIIPVILSGGRGSRLWPLSRAQRPKQFLPLTSNNTMIQETILRLQGLDFNRVIVVCNESHRFLVAEQLSSLDIPKPEIILEPIARNTAPAIAAAALQAIKTDKEAKLLVLSADHTISDIKTFQTAIITAEKKCDDESLIAFGIKPNTPETGYGYIRADIQNTKDDFYKLSHFVEKPNLQAAQKYLASGEYFWNSGMLFFKATTFLNELKTLQGEIYKNTLNSFVNAKIDLDFIRLNKDDFSKNQTISVDYAVMEHTKKGKVIPLSVGWNDVGCWSSLWEINKKDQNDNVIKGDVISIDTTSSYIYSDKKLITTVGVKNLIIIDTNDSLLVADKNASQDVKKIVDILKDKNRNEAAESSH